MAFTKITNSELNSRGATTLPNVPTIGATALKQEFDAPAKNIVAPKFNNLIDELQATSSAESLGAAAPTGRSGSTVQGVLNSISSDLTSVESNSHAHSNKSVIDKFTDDGTGLNYDGSPISGAVESVNNKTGAVVLNAEDVGALPDDTTIPTALADLSDDSSHRVVSDTEKSEWNAKADISDIPTALADLTDDASHRLVSDTEKSTWNGKSTVTWDQQVVTGQKIATISIDGTPTDVYAPTGGSPGTGAVNSVNSMQGDVVLNVANINDVTISGLAANDALVYDNGWGNKPLADVALTGDYADISGTPVAATTVTDGLMSAADKAKLDGVAAGAEANVQADWDQANSAADDFIKNKPTIPAAQIQSDWNQADTTAKDYIKNKPSVLGHDMIPIYDSQADITDIEKIYSLNNGNDNFVINAYSAKRWSNCECTNLLTTAPVDVDGIGKWVDTWETDDDREGWLWSKELYRVLADEYGNSVLDKKIDPVFDVIESETVGLLSYRIDDDFEHPTTHENGGCVAFKFTGKVKTQNGVKVGLSITHLRTNTFAFEVLP